MPEEQNRIVADHLSTHLLCPTETAIENLQKEGITEGVVNIGDIMLDAVHRMQSQGIYLSQKDINFALQQVNEI